MGKVSNRVVGGFIACSMALVAGPVFGQDVTSPGPARNSHGQSPLEGAKTSKLLLSQSIERSEQQLNGRAVEATFTPHATGGGAHEIIVLKPDGTLTRNHIDGRSEAVVGVTDEKISSLLTSLTPAAVGKSKGLLAVVRDVERRSPEQRVIGAEAEQDGEVVTFAVTIATPTGDETLNFDASGTQTPK